ncbi:hypothetical protein ACS0TY_024463 [Phlomoides rotata]
MVTDNSSLTPAQLAADKNHRQAAFFLYWSFLRNTRNDSALYVILLLDFSNSFACQSTIMKWNIFQHGEKLDREKVWLIMIL